jgi:hypothetical protein
MIPPPEIRRLRTLCRMLTQEAVANVRKFDETRYVPRLDAESAHQRYLASPSRVFLVLGDSGKGKTNLLCQLALASADDRPTLFVAGLWRYGSSERVLGNILSRLKAEMGRNHDDLWTFMRYLHEQLSSGATHLEVFVDGINETDDQPWVLNGFREALQHSQSTIRFTISCRTDSFRLRYREPFWRDHVYQDTSGLGDHYIAGKRSTAFLNKLAQHARQDKTLTDQQRALVETALIKQLRESAARPHPTTDLIASAFLSSFTESEFEQAIGKYRLTAQLVGEARETCHDPLMFKFFFDSFGHEAREVSELFTVTNASAYLTKTIADACTKGFQEDAAQALIFKIAKESSKHSHRSGAGQGATLANPDEINLAEALVDSGLLLWRRWSRADGARTVAFSFDRILSFILALQAKERGKSTLIGTLLRILDEESPNEIDVHQCYYLLLLLDGQEDQVSSVRNWIAICLRRRPLRGAAILALPEITQLSQTEVLDIIRKLLSRVVREPRRDTLQPQGVTPETRAKPISTVYTAADALSAMARRGAARQVVAFVEDVLTASIGDERTTFWFPLLKPLAVTYPELPEISLRLIESICDSYLEIELDRAWTRRHLTDQECLRIIKEEFEQFPAARLPLVHSLVKSRLACLRSLCAFAIPGLQLAGSPAVAGLLLELQNDPDAMVRGSIGEIVPSAFTTRNLRATCVAQSLKTKTMKYATASSEPPSTSQQLLKERDSVNS